jgi:hypothetical protein
MIQDYYTKIKSSDDFVVLAHLLLKNESQRDDQILKRFSSNSSKGIVTFLPAERLDLDLVYSKDQIKTLCRRNHFRLRHASETNVQLKSEVIGQIKELEKRYSVIFKSFYLLTNHENDGSYHMLFCKLSNGCFFKIDEDVILVNRLKSIVLKSQFSLILSVMLPSLLVAVACSFISWPIQLTVSGVTLLFAVGFVWFNKWNEQITSRKWWLV